MKRKNIALITLALGIGILFSACNDYLDSDKYFEDRTTIEKVFTSRIRSQQWLAYAYSFLKDENADVVGKEKETTLTKAGQCVTRAFIRPQCSSPTFTGTPK